MRLISGSILAATLVAAAAACGGDAGNTTSGDTAQGATGQTAATTSPAGGAMSPQDIFGAMAAANAAEIAAGQLAADSASSSEVKEFGRLMVSDHEAMNREAHQAAEQAGIQSQAGGQTDNVVQSSRDIAGELRGKRGAEFDRAFMDAMVRSHEETLALLDRAAQAQGGTPQLATVVTNARQKVQQHLERARQVQSRLQGG